MMSHQDKKTDKQHLTEEERLKAYHDLASELSKQISGKIFYGSHDFDLRAADTFCKILQEKLREIAKGFQM